MLHEEKLSKHFCELLAKYYGEEKAEKLLNILGVSVNKLSPYKRTQELIETDDFQKVSTDPNSNVGNNVAYPILRYMPFKPLQKMVTLSYLFDGLTDKYGKNEAERIICRLLDGTYYFHDLSCFGPYCAVFDVKDLFLEGRTYVTPKSRSPKRPQSFINQVIETVMNLCQEFAGAIALNGVFVCYAAAMLKHNINKYDGDISRACYATFRLDKKTKKEIENHFQSMVHVFNNPFRNGYELPFTNISIFTEPILLNLMEEAGYWSIIEQLGVDLDDSFKNDFIDLVKKIQLIFVDFMAKGDPSNDGAPYRFPVTTINIAVDENGEILDTKYAKKLLSYNTKGYFNIFNAFNTVKTASCCRLVNDYELMRGLDSFGNGAYFTIGSFRVVSINLPRFAYMFRNKYDDVNYDIIKKELYNYLNDIRKVHIVFRDLLKKYVLPYHLFTKLGWANWDLFFSTFGFIGIAEAAEIIGREFSKDQNYFTEVMRFLLEAINEIVEEFIKEDKIPYNIEQVPGESLAITFAKQDEVIFGKSFADDEIGIYSNQMIPLWWAVDLHTKAKLEANFYQLLTGGGISHLNSQIELTSDQIFKFAKYAAAIGLEHYAINPMLCFCEDNHLNFGVLDKCKKCGKPIEKYLTRVVGYFTPVDYWPVLRRDEFKERKILIK